VEGEASPCTVKALVANSPLMPPLTANRFLQTANRLGRTRPRRGEAKAYFVYLIKRAASPEKLSILKIVRSSGGLAFQIETGVKFLLRPFRLRGEWFNCSEALALLALRAAETGELECRACVAAEIEARRLAGTLQQYEAASALAGWYVRKGWIDVKMKTADALLRSILEMWKRWPDFMREVGNS